jgi:hypothetical protein
MCKTRVYPHACGVVCAQSYLVPGNCVSYIFFFLQNYTVEVLYSPLFIVPLTETIFLTPAFRNMFPFTEANIPQIKELHLAQHKVCGWDSQCMGCSCHKSYVQQFVICYVYYSFYSVVIVCLLKGVMNGK